MPPTGPGFYIIQYFDFLQAHRFVGPNGRSLPLPRQDMSLFVPVTQPLYVLQDKIFGIAHPGVTAILPVLAAAQVDDGLHNTVLNAQTGMADTHLAAFLAFDPITKDKQPIFAQMLEFDLIAPTGAYNRNIVINPGSNFVSFDPFYAATLWLTKKWSVSTRIHYLWNLTNDAPNIIFGPDAVTSLAGQAVHINFASLYQFSDTFGLGINGFYLQQVTNTQVNGLAVPGGRERVVALGPGAIFNISKDYSVFINDYQEFWVQNRPQTNKIVVRINMHF
ncbi:MAG: SphA family protein [Methylovirgula sp.]